MILPFSRNGQEAEAESLAAGVRCNRPPVVHVFTFPNIQINHSILLYAVHETADAIQFAAYDPNNPEMPVELTFDRKSRQFSFPQNDYWKGGELNVYEIYRAWNY